MNDNYRFLIDRLFKSKPPEPSIRVVRDLPIIGHLNHDGSITVHGAFTPEPGDRFIFRDPRPDYFITAKALILRNRRSAPSPDMQTMLDDIERNYPRRIVLPDLTEYRITHHDIISELHYAHSSD